MLTGRDLLPYFLRCKKVTTDSRAIEPESMFFALKGENFDGNKFAVKALESGASFAVVSDVNLRIDDRFLLVEDTLLALQELAIAYRQSFTIPFIGITGSNGKTTTKELLTAVLSQKYRVHATKGNFNNHIGVPLTLLAMPSNTEIAVIEMGANKVGDIAELCAIALPTHGLITNIGRAHIEGFGGIEGVIRGKSELYQHLILHEGTVFINSNEFILLNMAKRFKNPYLYGHDGNYFYAKFLDAKPFIRFETQEGQTFEAQISGNHNFQNILSALGVGKFFEVDADKALQAVISYAPDNKRSQVVEKRSNKILLDCYNANPESMVAGLQSLANFEAEKHIAILGEMAELGVETLDLHRQVLASIREKNIKIDTLICCGDTYKNAINLGIPNNTPIQFFETETLMLEWLKQNKFENSAILIKASRSQAYERLLEYIV